MKNQHRRIASRLARSVAPAAVLAFLLQAGALEALAGTPGSAPVTVQLRFHDKDHSTITEATAGQPLHLRVAVFPDQKTDLDPTGSVEVADYIDAACTTRDSIGPGIALALSNGISDDTLKTFYPPEAKTYYLRARYPGDGTFEAEVSPCVALLVRPAPALIELSFRQGAAASTFLAGSRFDAIIRIGPPRARNATGVVDLTWYADAGCTNRVGGFDDEALGVGGAILQLALPVAGAYWFRAFYGGDANHAGGVSTCTPVEIVRSTQAVHLGLHDPDHTRSADITPSTPIHTLIRIESSVPLPVLGTVELRWYPNGTCSGTPGLARSFDLQLLPESVITEAHTTGLPVYATPGTRSFSAAYPGNESFNPSESECLPYTVVGAAPTATTAATQAAPSAAAPTATDGAPLGATATPIAPGATGVPAPGASPLAPGSAPAGQIGPAATPPATGGGLTSGPSATNAPSGSNALVLVIVIVLVAIAVGVLTAVGASVRRRRLSS